MKRKEKEFHPYKIRIWDKNLTSSASVILKKRLRKYLSLFNTASKTMLRQVPISILRASLFHTTNREEKKKLMPKKRFFFSFFNIRHRTMQHDSIYLPVPVIHIRTIRSNLNNPARVPLVPFSHIWPFN